MAKRALSNHMIKNAQHRDKPYDIWDSRQNGLFVKVGKTTKTFYCYTSTRKTLKIDRWGYDNGEGIGIDNARMKARKLLEVNTVYTDVSRMTLSHYLDNRYQADRLSGKPVTDSTIKKIKSAYPDWLDKKLSKITNEMMLEKISQWLAGTHKINTDDIRHKTRTAKQNSPGSVRKKYVEMNAVFNTLVAKKHISKNPFEPLGIKKDGPPDFIRVYCSETVTYEAVLNFLFTHGRRKNSDEITRYIKQHSEAARLFIALVIRLGLRDGEARKNYIYNFITDGPNPVFIIPKEITKTGKGRRIPLSDPVLLSAIIDYKDNHYVENPQQLMFYNREASAMFSRSLGRGLYKELSDAFNLKGNKRDFRHTFATRIYHATGDIKLTSFLIGDNINTTSDYYADDNIEKARDVIANMR